MPKYEGGYMGKILKVDLSTGETGEVGLPSDDVLKKYVGCWGISLRYLYDLLPPGYTATDPENPLIFMTSPLTGLPLPGATNVTLATKNFDTGFTVGRSHTHSSFGLLMKKAGFDGIIITGQSDKPVYLWVHDCQAELRDASHLWGKTDTHEAEDAIKKELDNSSISVAAIGPCGENVCASGAIMNDKHHGFCHSGGGSIMGNKKLKAIAVFGKQPIPAADPGKIALLKKEWIRHFKMPGHLGWNTMRNAWLRKDEYRHRLKDLGFAGKNFQVNQLTEFGLGWAKQKYTMKPCPGCPIGCSYNVKITTGPHKGSVFDIGGGGEALEGAGSMLCITEPGTIYYLTDLYDRFGIDGGMAGSVLAMAIEAYEKGLITTKDTDGLELRWGDAKVAEALLRKMVYRDGKFGEILARGVKGAAEAIGGDAPSFAVHVKGAGTNLHDWRAVWGILFGQIVSSGAGWPAQGSDFAPEPDAGYPQKTERFDSHAVPMAARKMGIIKFLNDCCGFCMLTTWGMQDVLQLTADSLNAATGWVYTREELLEVGERVMQLERAFNVRHGLKPEDDWTVPARLVDAPNDGPAKGISIKPHLEGMVKEYHKLMGWDEKTGKPWKTTLEKVGLDDVMRDLWG